MYQIGDFAKKVGLSARMLRHYEKLGLIKPVRVGKDYRSYDDSAVLKVSQIKFFQQLGFSLKEINSIMSLRSNDIQNNLLNLYNKKELESDLLEKQINQIKTAVEIIATRPISFNELIHVPILSVNEREDFLKATNLKNRVMRGRAPLLEIAIDKTLEEMSNEEMKYKIITTDLCLFGETVPLLPRGFTAVFEALQAHSFFYFHCSEPYLLSLVDEKSDKNISNESLMSQAMQSHAMEIMITMEKWWSNAFFPLDFSFTDITSDPKDILHVHGTHEVTVHMQIEVTKNQEEKFYIYLGLPAPFLYTTHHARCWQLHTIANGDIEKVREVLPFYPREGLPFFMNEIKKAVEG